MASYAGASGEPDAGVATELALNLPPASATSHQRVSAAMPAPLGEMDAGRYRRIFAFQERGEWSRADREIQALDSRLLMGHVLLQRYMHPTAYRSEYAELAAWLKQFNDHPAAYRAYSLAQRRQPDGQAALTLPVYGQEHLRHMLADRKAPSRAQVTTAEHRQLAQAIRARIGRGHLTQATADIDSSSLPAEAADRLRGQVALGWLALGENGKALQVAGQAAERSRDRTSVPDWVAGLAAFTKGDYPAAIRFFSLHAQSPLAGHWNKAAGAFWAARAAYQAGQKPIAVNRWLEDAAKYPFTFYGQLALQQLGRPLLQLPRRRPAGAADIARLQSLPGGERVFALIQTGQIRRADEELLQYLSRADLKLARSITAVAEAAKLPQAAIRGASYLTNRKDEPTTAALYPTPDWQPQGGFAVDQALIWAFVRQESVFNPRATSGAGARGLMQLMPNTANYVAGEQRFLGARRDKLYSPSLNLTLGQRYLRYLMDKDLVADDLFRLAVAYNAGIGNLNNWKRDGLLASDPLMFIETLPLLETRLFVERVIANYWIYRALLGQPRPSLQAVLDGQWPRYRAQETPQVELAEDPRHGN